jgi:hypothetical protein
VHPVISKKSGHVYERELILKYLRDNDGKDPLTGEDLTEEDLVEVKTGESSLSRLVFVFFPSGDEKNTNNRTISLILSVFAL